ncbi:MFS transporter [Phaeovulum sp.]|uniref:MFS transporter n=1 Tax=Phaeovulum sp. TaxID=2934796 RepID=UPI003562DD55
MMASLSDQPIYSFRVRLAALSLAMLLPSLGTSIANVALPTLASAFAAPISDVQWVVISYLLAVTTLIVGVGRLGDMLGRRRVLLIGIGLFALASACGALAGNLWLLVAIRGAQGLGAAIMMALTIASVSDMVPKHRTGSAMGLLGTVSAVGTALGPSLGGVLINAFGWPAVFAFMAVAGGAAFVLGYRVFPADVAKAPKQFSFDFLGLAVLALSLGAYALSTTLGGQASGFANVGLAGLALIGLASFVAIESRAADPLVQLTLLQDRALTAGLASMGLVSTVLMATLVVGPFYLSGALGLSPAATGLAMSVGPGVSALIGFPAGRLVDRFGEASVTYAGLLGVAAGSVLMILLPTATGVAGYVSSLAVITASYALFQAANNTAVMNGAAGERRGVTSALLGLSRNLGLITGASAMGAVFAFGSKGEGLFSLGNKDAAGLQLTFAVAAGLACIALCAALFGRR